MISVVICTYNRADMLRKTLESFLAQDGLGGIDHEILVVDNNSSDATCEVVRSFEDHPSVRYVFEPEQGLSAARNRGIAESRGEIVAFLDDDVVVDPNWLEHMCRCFQETNAAVVGGRAYLIFEADTPDWFGEELATMFGEVDLGAQRTQLPEGRGLFGLNLAFRREILHEAGCFDEALGRKGKALSGGEETAVLRRVGGAGCMIVYEPDAVVGHVIPPERAQWEYIDRQARGMGLSQVAGQLPASFPVRLLRLIRSAVALALTGAVFVARRAGQGDGPGSRSALRKFITAWARLGGHWRVLWGRGIY